MYDKLIDFAQPYEVLTYEDTDSEYIGQNIYGDFILGFLAEEIDGPTQKHIYIIAPPSALLQYFEQKSSTFDLGAAANYIFELEKNSLGHILACKIIDQNQWHSDYMHLRNAFYYIAAPQSLAAIRHAAEKETLYKNIAAALIQFAAFYALHKLQTPLLPSVAFTQPLTLSQNIDHAERCKPVFETTDALTLAA